MCAMHSIVTTFREAVIKVEVANFGAAMDTSIDEDDIKVEFANFCAAMDTLIDQDVEAYIIKTTRNVGMTSVTDWRYRFSL